MKMGCNRKNGLNIYYYIGITSLVVVQVLSRLTEIPDFIHGFGVGLSIVMLLASALYSTGKLQKLRALKQRILFGKQ